MIPIVCFCSLLFGNWSLRWDAKNERFRFSYCFVFTSALIFCTNALYFVKLFGAAKQYSKKANPQHLLLMSIHINIAILLVNRWLNAKQDEYFANELYVACARTVESGRHLPEFWFRMTMLCLSGCGVFHKYWKLMGANVFGRVVVPSMCNGFATATAECVYATACNAIADEFAAINRRTEAVTAITPSAEIRWLSSAHCRLVRLVRLCNGQYGAAMFLTTLNLMLALTNTMNDFVSIFLNGDWFDSWFKTFSLAFDLYTWLSYWWRFWWVCYRVHHLVEQVHLTRKIMFAKDLNSYPEDTRQLALDFLDQLLHRNIRITAWGFYNVNMELLFTALGYQFGVCLICSQFTTTSILFFNDQNITAVNATAGGAICFISEEFVLEGSSVTPLSPLKPPLRRRVPNEMPLEITDHNR